MSPIPPFSSVRSTLGGLNTPLPDAYFVWTVLAISYERWRAEALAGLVPRLPEPLLDEVLRVAVTINDH